MGFYLPASRILNAHFAGQILRGEKLLLKKEAVKKIGAMYSYKDCSKQVLYANFPDQHQLLQYLPCDFLFQPLIGHIFTMCTNKLINTLVPHWVDNAFRECIKKRNEVGMTDVPIIELSEDFKPLLESQLYKMTRSMFTTRSRVNRYD